MNPQDTEKVTIHVHLFNVIHLNKRVSHKMSPDMPVSWLLLK